MYICIKLIFIFKFYGIEVIQLYSLNLELNQVFHFMKKKCVYLIYLLTKTNTFN